MGGSQETVMVPFSSRGSDLALEIYKSLRAEIMEYVTAIRLLEVGCITAMAVSYGFLLTSSAVVNSGIPLRIWLLLPGLIPLFCAARLFTLHSQIGMIARYLDLLEQQFKEDGFWEHHLTRHHRKSWRYSAIGWSNYAVYAALLFGLASVVTLWKL